MAYYAIVTDNWEPCPGTIRHGPFTYRKEAQAWIDREIEAAKELFVDKGVTLTASIVKT